MSWKAWCFVSVTEQRKAEIDVNEKKALRDAPKEHLDPTLAVQLLVNAIRMHPILDDMKQQ